MCSGRAGNRMYSHGGGGPGIDTGFQFFLDKNLVVIFLSNYSPPFPQDMAGKIAALLQ